MQRYLVMAYLAAFAAFTAAAFIFVGVSVTTIILGAAFLHRDELRLEFHELVAVDGTVTLNKAQYESHIHPHIGKGGRDYSGGSCRLQGAKGTARGVLLVRAAGRRGDEGSHLAGTFGAPFRI